VECWGRDSYEYHDIHDQTHTFDWDVTSPPSETFERMSAGGYHTCGITSSGSVECWGRDDFGQSSPPSGTFESMSAGGYHTCGITSSGSVECWGYFDGEFGHTIPAEDLPQTPSGTFESVSAGGYHTCGITSSGNLECWGDDGQGQSSPPEL
jgi:alpha-tubulin suppressor-like RCC1 family protein